MKQLLSVITAVIITLFGCTGFCAADKQIDANVKTKRVPEGTVIPLRMLDTADSLISSPGTACNFAAAEDIKSVDGAAAIPAGSIVRGSIEDAKPAGRLYKGGVIRIYFDHIVSTSGRQIPFYAGIYNNPNASFDGALSSNTTYSDAFKKTVSNTKNVVKEPVIWAWDKGDDVFNGWPKYIFAPVTGIVCVPAAALYFIGDTIADLFKKGREMSINKGEVIYVQLIKPLDMPVY